MLKKKIVKKTTKEEKEFKQQLQLQADQVQKRIQAVSAAKLRLAGYTIEEIMEQLNFETPAAVQLAIANVIKQFPNEAKADLRQLENHRLEKLLKAIWPHAVGDNDQNLVSMSAVDRVLKIMERRSRMFGLDNDVSAAPAQPALPKPPAQFTDADRAKIIQDILVTAAKRKKTLDEAEKDPSTTKVM